MSLEGAQTRTPLSRNHRSLIVTEGDDDRSFAIAIVQMDGLPGVDCWDARGGKKLRSTVIAALQAPGPRVERFGLIRDAEGDADAAIQSARDLLRDIEWPCPEGAFEVASDGGRKSGFAILPDGTRPGGIEDLCVDAPTNAGAWQCTEKLFECLDEANCANHGSEIVRKKAMIQAYLAASAESRVVHRVGLGISKNQFDLENQVFSRVRAFLRELLA